MIADHLGGDHRYRLPASVSGGPSFGFTLAYPPSSSSVDQALITPHTMLGLASSSSRISASLSSSLTFIRTKKTSRGSHFPKQPLVRSYKPRIPKSRSPHDPRTPNPNAGASQPHPLEYQPFIPKTTSVALEESHLRLHHSPPASAPSYTTGVVPTLLQWLGGNPTQLTGEEQARRKYQRKEKLEMQEGMTPPREWTEETKAQITAWRQEGMSQGLITKRYVQCLSLVAIKPGSSRQTRLASIPTPRCG